MDYATSQMRVEEVLDNVCERFGTYMLVTDTKTNVPSFVDTNKGAISGKIDSSQDVQFKFFSEIFVVIHDYEFSRTRKP